jgi:hypothetical protein
VTVSLAKTCTWQGEIRIKIWWTIEADGNTISLAGQVREGEGGYHHKPTDLHAREQFDKLKEVFADHTGWNEEDTSVELNVGEQSWSVLQAIETGFYHMKLLRVTVGLSRNFWEYSQAMRDHRIPRQTGRIAVGQNPRLDGVGRRSCN